MASPSPAARANTVPAAGMKVVLVANQKWGAAEIVAYKKPHDLTLRFYTSACSYVERKVLTRDVKRKHLGEGTRIYLKDDGAMYFGHILQFHRMDGEMAVYWVKIGGDKKPRQMREDEYVVRSALPMAGSALEELKSFAHETPFFFERRNRLLHALGRQRAHAGPLVGLISSRVMLLPHQMLVCARMGSDPVVRYLLADEVGLGKTIEAGAAIRQALDDDPRLRVAVFVPDVLLSQWRAELNDRFDLRNVPVLPYAQLGSASGLDFAVVDEAHRLVGSDQLTAVARKLAHGIKHLLLLTATPGLHDTQTMLRLLELLDPAHYSVKRLAEFERLLQQRGDLGRMVLALQSARTPLVIRRQLRGLAQLLAKDHSILQWADASAVCPDGDVAATRDKVLVHVGETYRLHRRMLRTRRKWVLEGQPNLARKVDVMAEYAIEEDPGDAAWRHLDAWRGMVATRIPEGNSDRSKAISAYFRLAEVLAGDPELLPATVAEVSKALPPEENEAAQLQMLAGQRLRKELVEQQDACIEAICQRLRADGQGVMFCPSADAARRFSERLRRRRRDAAIGIATHASTPAEIEKALRAFHTGECELLLTDELGEEGLNLQAARYMIWVGLPWSPMRLEQRTGRLDRVDRSGRIQCRLLIAGEDEALYLDEAWRQLVMNGLGIFRASISDLAHVIARELPRWSEAAFAVGPVGLENLVRELPALVEAERAAIDEQDVIDGLQWSARETAELADPVRVEGESEELEDALSSYLRESVGLKVQRRELDGCLVVSRDPNDALLPPEQVESLRDLFAAPLTAMRSIAIETPGSAFFRPGHASFKAMEQLLAWDDRGRAYVLWRRVPEWSEPRVVFRIEVSVEIAVDEELGAEMDAVSRAGFNRTLRRWFPDQTREVFLMPDGSPADAKTVAICSRRYDNRQDLSLGKQRAESLRTSFGERRWVEWCDTASEHALASVRNGEQLRGQLTAACAQAAAHFTQQRALTLIRKEGGWDGAEDPNQWECLEALAKKAFSRPVVCLDTLGAYVLSAEPLASDE